MKPFDNCISPMEREYMNHRMHLNEMRELDDFKRCITDIVENYIRMIDDKITSQDLNIKNISGVVLRYHPESEELELGV